MCSIEKTNQALKRSARQNERKQLMRFPIFVQLLQIRKLNSASIKRSFTEPLEESYRAMHFNKCLVSASIASALVLALLFDGQECLYPP